MKCVEGVDVEELAQSGSPAAGEVNGGGGEGRKTPPPQAISFPGRN